MFSLYNLDPSKTPDLEYIVSITFLAKVTIQASLGFFVSVKHVKVRFFWFLPKIREKQSRFVQTWL